MRLAILSGSLVIHYCNNSTATSRRRQISQHRQEVVELIKKFIENDIIVVGGKDDLAVEAQNNATSLYAILIRSMLLI